MKYKLWYIYYVKMENTYVIYLLTELFKSKTSYRNNITQILILKKLCSQFFSKAE